GTRVVVRIVEPRGNDRAVQQLQRETRALSNIESEHVARIYDVGNLPDGALYLVRERIDGASVAAHLRSRGMLPIADAPLVFFQLADAGQQAHGAGIAPRDLGTSSVYRV